MSVRYGYFSDLRFRMLHDITNTFDFIAQDQLTSSWINLGPRSGFRQELDSVLFRNHIEEPFFTFAFLERLDSTLI